MNDEERLKLKVCSAVLTKNRALLESSLTVPEDVLGRDLYLEVREVLAIAPVPGQSRLETFSRSLPASIQYVGQRAVLLFPKLAYKILRASGLHHRMY